MSSIYFVLHFYILAIVTSALVLAVLGLVEQLYSLKNISLADAEADFRRHFDSMNDLISNDIVSDVLADTLVSTSAFMLDEKNIDIVRQAVKKADVISNKIKLNEKTAVFQQEMHKLELENKALSEKYTTCIYDGMIAVTMRRLAVSSVNPIKIFREKRRSNITVKNAPSIPSKRELFQAISMLNSINSM